MTALSRFRLPIISLSILVPVAWVIDFWPLPIRPLWTRFPQLKKIRSLTKPLDIFALSQFKSSHLPLYQLFILPQDIHTATLRLDQNDYSVTISSEIPGQFILNSPNPINGHTKMVIAPIEATAFLTEATSQWYAKKMGSMSRTGWFVRLSVNGQSPGLFYVEESLSKDTLEINRRNSDSDIYVTAKVVTKNPPSPIFMWEKISSNPIDPINFAPLQQLFDVAALTDAQLKNRGLRQLIDIDSFNRWNVHRQLFSTKSHPITAAPPLYFNRESGKFEFIPNSLLDTYPASSSVNKIIEYLNALPDIQTAQQQIQKSVENSTTHAQAIAAYDQISSSINSALAADQHKPYSTLFGNLRIKEMSP